MLIYREDERLVFVPNEAVSEADIVEIYNGIIDKFYVFDINIREFGREIVRFQDPIVYCIIVVAGDKYYIKCNTNHLLAATQWVVYEPNYDKEIISICFSVAGPNFVVHFLYEDLFVISVELSSERIISEFKSKVVPNEYGIGLGEILDNKKCETVYAYGPYLYLKVEEELIDTVYNIDCNEIRRIGRAGYECYFCVEEHSAFKKHDPEAKLISVYTHLVDKDKGLYDNGMLCDGDTPLHDVIKIRCNHNMYLTTNRTLVSVDNSITWKELHNITNFQMMDHSKILYIFDVEGLKSYKLYHNEWTTIIPGDVSKMRLSDQTYYDCQVNSTKRSKSARSIMTK